MSRRVVSRGMVRTFTVAHYQGGPSTGDFFEALRGKFTERHLNVRSAPTEAIDRAVIDVTARLRGDVEAVAPHYRINLLPRDVDWEEAVNVDAEDVGAEWLRRQSRVD